MEVRRGSHHGFMDLRELFLGTIALDPDGVAEALVTGRHIGIDAKEPPEIDLALGFDLQTSRV